MDGRDVDVYSIHIETAWLGSEKRGDQVETSLESMDGSAPYVVVGGDFNTVTREGVTDLANLFAEAGFSHVSAETGPTFSVAGLRVTTDHLFARGFDVVNGGVVEETAASDHSPLWAGLHFVE